jgi:mannosyltransferase OCH1-like enzyme
MSDDKWDSKTVECVKSWHKYIPDFEFKLWNYNTLPKDILEVPTIKNAIKHRKWAFVADHVRIWALYNYGGVYMDMDVEMLKSIENLLDVDLLLGMEREWLGAHFMGGIKGHPFLKYVLDKVAVKTSLQPLPDIITLTYKEYFKVLDITPLSRPSCTVYPNEYFNPFLWDANAQQGSLYKTDNTYVIHWYAGGWIPKWKKSMVYKVLIRLLDKIGILPVLRKIRGY